MDPTISKTVCLCETATEILSALQQHAEQDLSICDKRSYLLELPAELLERIAEYLPPCDLIPLRLSCSAIEKRTRRLFAKTHFTRPSFLLSDRRSMSILLCIVNHEEFLKYLQEIRYSSLRLVDTASFKRSCDFSHDIEGFPREILRNYFINLHSKFKQAEDRFGEELVPLLVSILTKLNTLQPKPLLKPYHPEHQGTYDYTTRGLRRLNTQFDRPGLHYSALDPGIENGDLHQKLYQAIVDSGYTTTKLTLGEELNPMPPSFLSYQPSKFPGERLKVLELYLDTNLRSPDDHDDEVCETGEGGLVRQRARDFVTIISRAPQLEELLLRQSDTNNASRSLTFHAMFHALTTKCYGDGRPVDFPSADSQNGSILVPKLQCLSLDDRPADFYTIVRFCEERQGTLKKLVLDRGDHEPFLDKEEARKEIFEAVGAEEGGEFELEYWLNTGEGADD